MGKGRGPRQGKLEGDGEPEQGGQEEECRGHGGGVKGGIPPSVNHMAGWTCVRGGKEVAKGKGNGEPGDKRRRA